MLDEGINVISAINIQHIESVNEEVQEITGIEVKERVPDSVLQEADEVVNIDLTAEELISRLKAGKIYRPEKIRMALDNFFRTENILQLRELALKEVALRVEKKVENEVVMGVAVGLRHEKFMACISSHERGRPDGLSEGRRSWQPGIILLLSLCMSRHRKRAWTGLTWRASVIC